MKLSLVIVAALAFAGVLAGEVSKSDSEIWNEGVEFYRAGDVTNALERMRPLLASPTHGARAAEVVAKLCREAADRLPPEAALPLREEALAAAQAALRAAPASARANRNFTRAADAMAELREEARINAVLKAAAGQDPGQMMRTATYETRRLMEAAAGLPAAKPAERVALSDSLSARSRKVADVWLPVREQVVQSVTNEQQAAGILAEIEDAAAKTRAAAGHFADLEATDAYSAVAEAEQTLTRFYKLMAAPPLAIDEDLVCQSNAWQDVAPISGRAWQQDALDFTRTFRRLFPEWARQYEQQAAADTNREPFTAEAQARIAELAVKLEQTQAECVERDLPPQQEQALACLQEIKSLLPKDRQQGGGGQSGSQNSPPPQSQPPQSQPPQGDQQGEEPPPEPADEPQGEGEEQQDQGGEDEGQSPEESEIEALLKEAQERNDEHEAEKKARMRKAPLPPNERDW